MARGTQQPPPFTTRSVTCVRVRSLLQITTGNTVVLFLKSRVFRSNELVFFVPRGSDRFHVVPGLFGVLVE